MKNIKVVNSRIIKPKFDEDKDIKIVGISFNSKYLVVGCQDYSVSYLNMESNEAIVLAYHENTLTSIECGKQINSLASASDDGYVNYWSNIENIEDKSYFRAHEQSILSMNLILIILIWQHVQMALQLNYGKYQMTTQLNYGKYQILNLLKLKEK